MYLVRNEMCAFSSDYLLSIVQVRTFFFSVQPIFLNGKYRDCSKINDIPAISCNISVRRQYGMHSKINGRLTICYNDGVCMAGGTPHKCSKHLSMTLSFVSPRISLFLFCHFPLG